MRSLAILILLFTSTELRAERKGFFFSMGGGAGKELKEYKKFGGVALGRIGGGLNDHLTLYYGAPTLLFQQTTGLVKTTYFIGGNQGGISYFFSKGSSFYVNLAGGLGVFYTNDPYISDGLKLGYSGLAGLGFELRFGRVFAIGIEGNFLLVKANRTTYRIPIGVLNFAWYF